VDPSGHSFWDFVLGAVVFTTIVIFALATGGAGVALFAVFMGGVGLGVGAIVAASLGYSPGSESFWQIAVTGAIIGAAIGAGGAQMLAEGEEAEAAASTAEDLALRGEEASDTTLPAKGFRGDCGNMLKSMAFGGPQSVLVHELNGGARTTC
jgi:hypothetical protein